MVKDKNTIWTNFFKEDNSMVVVLNENSNLVDAMSYNFKTKELVVWFKTNYDKYHYTYKNVDAFTFNEMLNSQSIGSYLIKNIISCKSVEKWNSKTCKFETCKQPKNIK